MFRTRICSVTIRIGIGNLTPDNASQVRTTLRSVNSGDAATAVLPWIAAFGGKVDVVFYGTTAASKDDPTSVWNTYLAQTTDDGSHLPRPRCPRIRTTSGRSR